LITPSTQKIDKACADAKTVLHTTWRLKELLQKFESTCLNCIVIAKSVEALSGQLGLATIQLEIEIDALEKKKEPVPKKSTEQLRQLKKSKVVLLEIAAAASQSATHFEHLLVGYRALLKQKQPEACHHKSQKDGLHKLIELTHTILHHKDFYSPEKDGAQATLTRSLSSLRIHMNAKSDFMTALLPTIKSLDQQSKDTVTAVIKAAYFSHFGSAVAFKSTQMPGVNFDPAPYLQSVLGDIPMFFTRIRDCVKEIKNSLPTLKKGLLTVEASTKLGALPKHTNILGNYANTLSAFECQAGLKLYIAEKAVSEQKKQESQLVAQQREAEAAEKAKAATLLEKEFKKEQRLKLSEQQLLRRQAEKRAACLELELAAQTKLLSKPGSESSVSLSSGPFSESDDLFLPVVTASPKAEAKKESAPVELVKSVVGGVSWAALLAYQQSPAFWSAPPVDSASRPSDSFDDPELAHNARYFDGRPPVLVGDYANDGVKGRVKSLASHFEHSAWGDGGTGLRRRT